MSIFTLGHSTHSETDFLLAADKMQMIVDVRSHPTSRWEQHRKENLEVWLPENRIQYLWMPSLGGWTAADYEEYHERMAAVGVDLAVYSRGQFPKQRIGADRVASGDGPEWTSQGLYDYSWFMSTPKFLEGADNLIKAYGGLDDPRIAIMCSEGLWWKCHRSLIADYLFWRGIFAGHLPPKPPKRLTTARFKRHSEVIGDRLLRYPAPVVAAWEAHLARK